MILLIVGLVLATAIVMLCIVMIVLGDPLYPRPRGKHERRR